MRFEYIYYAEEVTLIVLIKESTADQDVVEFDLYMRWEHEGKPYMQLLPDTFPAYYDPQLIEAVYNYRDEYILDAAHMRLTYDY